MKDVKGSKLLLGDQVIWKNPPKLGHAFIGLRKQIREEELCARLAAFKAQEQE
jgi:hypothetical protein